MILIILVTVRGWSLYLRLSLAISDNNVYTGSVFHGYLCSILDFYGYNMFE